MVLFGFCMARITTFIMRIAWTENVSNEGLMIAAQVLVSAGVLLQYVVNLICTKRLLDARHPGFGRHPLVRLAFHLLYISILALIVTMIVVMVRFFTGKTLSAGEDSKFSREDVSSVECCMLTCIIDLRKAAPIYFTIISFIPIPLATAVALVPSQIPEGSMVLGIGPSTLKIRLFIIYNVSFWLSKLLVLQTFLNIVSLTMPSFGCCRPLGCFVPPPSPFLGPRLVPQASNLLRLYHRL